MLRIQVAKAAKPYAQGKQGPGEKAISLEGPIIEMSKVSSSLFIVAECGTC